jgi:hypothetical protein
MGRSPREHPKQLALKLRHIRDALSLTQEQMAELLKRAKPSIRPGHVTHGSPACQWKHWWMTS